MSLINENIVQEEIVKSQDNQEEKSLNTVRSSFLSFLVERGLAVTAYFDFLGMNGPKEKVYINKSDDDCNALCCCAVLTIFPELLIDSVGLVACFLPSLFVDCCQASIGNTISHNMMMVEKKMLHINDDVVISNEFTISEIIDIQYRRGSLGQFLFNRNHYHHQPADNLVSPESREMNKKIETFHSSQLKGTIVAIVDGGNVDVEFKPIELEERVSNSVYLL